MLTDAKMHHCVQEELYCQRSWKNIAAVESFVFQFNLKSLSNLFIARSNNHIPALPSNRVTAGC
jgi:hypothetical protein